MTLKFRNLSRALYHKLLIITRPLRRRRRALLFERHPFCRYISPSGSNLPCEIFVHLPSPPSAGCFVPLLFVLPPSSTQPPAPPHPRSFRSFFFFYRKLTFLVAIAIQFSVIQFSIELQSNERLRSERVQENEREMPKAKVGLAALSSSRKRIDTPCDTSIDVYTSISVLKK